MDDKKRMSFYISREDLSMLDRVKQLKFYDKPYAELLRYLLRRGLEVEMERGKSVSV